jgi:hypothetical protein
MRIVSISKAYFDLCSQDSELLQKAARPCVLVLRLKFRGANVDFAVPLRSNISPNVPKEQYFALPPRPATKPRHRHGIHFIKMFPIRREFQVRFRTEGSEYYEKIQRIANEHTTEIVNSCQKYLDDYVAKGRPRLATDIDLLVEILRQHAASTNADPRLCVNANSTDSAERRTKQ